MKVSRRWIVWAHGPGAQDGQPLATSLCDLASAPGAGSIEVADPALIAELVDVAGLYVNPYRGDAVHAMGPWWMGQPRRLFLEGRSSLRSSGNAATSSTVDGPPESQQQVICMLRTSAPIGRRCAHVESSESAPHRPVVGAVGLPRPRGLARCRRTGGDELFPRASDGDGRGGWLRVVCECRRPLNLHQAHGDRYDKRPSRSRSRPEGLVDARPAQLG